MPYIMNDSYDPTNPTEVSDEFVERFTSAETLAFFRNLGGTECVSRRNGKITVRSTPPAGSEQAPRLVVFTPIA
jgi:hypothetical protein